MADPSRSNYYSNKNGDDVETKDTTRALLGMHISDDANDDHPVIERVVMTQGYSLTDEGGASPQKKKKGSEQMARRSPQEQRNIEGVMNTLMQHVNQSMKPQQRQEMEKWAHQNAAQAALAKEYPYPIVWNMRFYTKAFSSDILDTIVDVALEILKKCGYSQHVFMMNSVKPMFHQYGDLLIPMCWNFLQEYKDVMNQNTPDYATCIDILQTIPFLTSVDESKFREHVPQKDMASYIKTMKSVMERMQTFCDIDLFYKKWIEFHNLKWSREQAAAAGAEIHYEDATKKDPTLSKVGKEKYYQIKEKQVRRFLNNHSHFRFKIKVAQEIVERKIEGMPESTRAQIASMVPALGKHLFNGKPDDWIKNVVDGFKAEAENNQDTMSVLNFFIGLVVDVQREYQKVINAPVSDSS